MPSDNNSYADIRQIIIDAVNPIKEQLDRIYESLGREFVRKDAMDPRISALQKEIDDAHSRIDNMEQRSMGAPQKFLVYTSTAIGIILSIIALLTHFKF